MSEEWLLIQHYRIVSLVLLTFFFQSNYTFIYWTLFLVCCHFVLAQQSVYAFKSCF